MSKDLTNVGWNKPEAAHTLLHKRLSDLPIRSGAVWPTVQPRESVNVFQGISTDKQNHILSAHEKCKMN